MQLQFIVVGVRVSRCYSSSHVCSPLHAEPELLYTAITRGKRQVCLVGEWHAFEKAISMFAKDFRYTLLSELCWQTNTKTDAVFIF